MDYACSRWPDLNLYLSVQASGTNYEALRFYHENLGIRRAVLPRVPSLAQVRHVADNSPVSIEVFGFGSLCVMVEGRCILSRENLADMQAQRPDDLETELFACGRMPLTLSLPYRSPTQSAQGRLPVRLPRLPGRPFYVDPRTGTLSVA